MILPSELLALIEQGETHTVEFKKSTADITKDTYETVCSFSNRDGGHIFLGVKDNGTIIGIQPDCVDQMKKDFVTTINNGNKMYPPLYLIPIEYEWEAKTILYIRVPVSSNVCRCSGRIYDRNHEADIDITNNEGLVYQLYARKQDTYYVNKVFPVFSVTDLRHDLIERAREMTKVRIDMHPWLNMTDEEMLRSAGLILTDITSGKEGITLASILLFGTDNMILSVLSHHKTDAIFRVYNTDRYDDRDVIITNLLDSYDRLMGFGKRHLNDLFAMDGIISVSARDKILREIISNLLAHRDFSNAYVAKLVIEKERIFTENSNRSHGYGNLDLATFEPFPKNPSISKVFREIGLADELGSGMRNTYKYTQLYSNAEPEFKEGDIFRIIVPLSEAATSTVGPIENSNIQASTEVTTQVSTEVTTQVSTEVTTQVNPEITAQIKLSSEKLAELLVYCSTPKSRKELQTFCGIKTAEYFRKNIINPMIKNKMIRPTIPDKPNSRNQKYVKI